MLISFWEHPPPEKKSQQIKQMLLTSTSNLEPL